MYIVYFKKGDEPFPARADADFHPNSDWQISSGI